MKEIIALELAKGFAEAAKLGRDGAGYFLDVLSGFEPEEQDAFYQRIPENGHFIPGTGEILSFHLDWILVNKQAQEAEISRKRRVVGDLGEVFGICYSDSRVRDLRANPTLMQVLAAAEKPYSLIGRRVVDYAVGDNWKSIDKPILIVPGVASRELMNSWEKRNRCFGDLNSLLERNYLGD